MPPKSVSGKPVRPGGGKTGLAPRLRRFLLTLHLVVGLSAGLLVSLTGMTGSLLVFRPEIERLTEPQFHRAAFSGRPGGTEAPVSLEQVLATVQHDYPQKRIQHLFVADGPEHTHEVWLAGTERERVYINPYTGRVLGAYSESVSFTGWLFALHTKLLSEETGEKVVGYGGLTLIFLSLSGLYLWWPFHLRQLPDRLRIKWQNKSGLLGPRFNYDLHRTGGFYATTLLLVIAVTGSGLVFDDAFKNAAFQLTATRATPPRPKVVIAQKLVTETAVPPASLSALLYNAETALPGGTLRRISFPAKSDAPLIVCKRMPGDLHPNGTTYIYLDPYTGTVLRVDETAKASTGQRLVDLRYPIHIGHWGGLFTRTLHALIGLAPLILFITGFRIWWRRIRTQSKNVLLSQRYKSKPIDN